METGSRRTYKAGLSARVESHCVITNGLIGLVSRKHIQCRHQHLAKCLGARCTWGWWLADQLATTGTSFLLHCGGPQVLLPLAQRVLQASLG